MKDKIIQLIQYGEVGDLILGSYTTYIVLYGLSESGKLYKFETNKWKLLLESPDIKKGKKG